MKRARPRAFEEVRAAMDPADRARVDRIESFVDPGEPCESHNKVVFGEHQDGTWFVAHQDSDGGMYDVTFSGEEAERRARAYFAALKSGACKIVRAGPPRH
jgi:hypothetical protein